MKIILLWDPRFPVSAPLRLAVHDDIASACVRAGVAAAADPAQQGALAAGAPINADDLRAVALQSGLPGFERIDHVVLPAAVATVAGNLGLCAAISGTPIAGGAPVPFPAGLISRFRVRDIPAQADNSDMATTWAATVGSATATAGAAKPKYRTNVVNGLPGLQFDGSQGMPLSNAAAIAAAIDSKESTTILVLRGISAGGDTYNSAFGWLDGSANGVCIMAGTQCGVGLYANGDTNFLSPRMPYTAELDDFMTVGYTGTETSPNGSHTTLYINGGSVVTSQRGTVGVGANQMAFGATGAVLNVSRFKGYLFDAYFWARELSNSEFKQAEVAIRAEYAKQPAWSGKTSYPVFVGSSLISAEGTAQLNGFVYKTCMGAGGLGLKYGQWDNCGHGFASWNDLAANGAREVDGVAAFTGIPTVLVAQEMFNSRNNDPVAQSLSYLAARRTGGVSAARTLLWTTADYQDPRTGKAIYTAYWDTAANRTGKVGGYVPMHSDARVGADGACANTTYFNPDQLHWSAGGHTVAASLIQPVLAAML